VLATVSHEHHAQGMCTGIHAAKIGDRFAALDPFSQGLLGEFGSVAADADRGLSLRMDDGSQYTSDDLRDQIRFWGFAPSYAFVAERFNRTMKEQAIHGRIFNNLGGSSCRRRVQGSIQSATGVLKSWASNHPLKPVRHR
jgi:hypothetical protein